MARGIPTKRDYIRKNENFHATRRWHSSARADVRRSFNDYGITARVNGNKYVDVIRLFRSAEPATPDRFNDAVRSLAEFRPRPSCSRLGAHTRKLVFPSDAQSTRRRGQKWPVPGPGHRATLTCSARWSTRTSSPLRFCRVVPARKVLRKFMAAERKRRRYMHAAPYTEGRGLAVSKRARAAREGYLYVHGWTGE